MSRENHKPRAILERITKARVALVSEIYGLSEEELGDSSAMGTWSIKESMAHLGRWEEICCEGIQGHL